MYALYFWVIVQSNPVNTFYKWEMQGTFQSEKACVIARKELSYYGESWSKCINTHTGKSSQFTFADINE